MQVKTCAATVKAAGAHEGVDEGVVEAIVAAYNVDSVGDKIIPGAFKNTLERRKASGRPLPFVWSHKSDDPDYHIGVVEEAEERDEGLWVKARLDLDEPKAAKVFKLLKGRRITEFSFAYDEVDVRPAEKSDDGARKELHELEIFECGPTMIGCNRATSLVGVKHDQPPVTVTVNTGGSETKTEAGGAAVVEVTANTGGSETKTEAGGAAVVEVAAKISDSATTLAKAGRVLSKRNEELVEQIATLAAQLLESVKSADPDETSNAEKATPTEPADSPASQVADEAAAETKSVESAGGTAPARLHPPVDLLHLMELEADAETY